ncbi:MAG: prephenate dehydrogenase dimerization domain-containing protein, partial [Ruthenibacterium sp.]
NETLWSELFLLNKDVLAKEIDTFIAALTDLKDKLKAGDENGLQQLFKQSTARRAHFDVK